MRRHSLTRGWRTGLAFALTFVVSLAAASGAQAVVVNDQGTTAGVALVPGDSPPSGVSAVTSNGSCNDPWLSSDLGGPLLPSNGLCYHGGAVMHKNETFALTWDARRAYWSGTRGYVEQFLRDVADGSGTLTSPYAVTTQYSDSGGRAENTSVYGGGCIDYGTVGGSSCEFGDPAPAGHDFPVSGCSPSGNSFTSVAAISENSICLTDEQLQYEVSAMVNETGLVGRTQKGYTPVVMLLLPPGVETCLDAAGKLCSANGVLTPPPSPVSTATTGGNIAAGTYHVVVTYVTGSGESSPSSSQIVTTTGATSTITIDSPPVTTGVTGWYAYVTDANGTSYVRQQTTPTAIGADLTLTSLATDGAAPPVADAFCSYHSQVDVGGTKVAYVVQPWTAGTSCDEPDAPPIPQNPTPEQLATDVGIRLVSPLSQAHIAAIVNPGLDGWYALDGSESDDNGGCVPLSQGDDKAIVGNSSQNPYFLRREFNNAGAIESDPNTYFGCAPGVILSPAFVVPSAVNRGDVIEFDGSASASTLIVPRAAYLWSFGDGTTAVGPSVEHSYSKAGTYVVTLTVTDRGGNEATLSQAVDVLGPAGSVATTPGLHARLLLMPQSLRAVLRQGISMLVSSNKAAAGFVTVSISRSAAKRAHIKAGHGGSVVIGRGTVSDITDGMVDLHLRMSRSVAAKLRHLRRLTLTVKLALVSAGGGHLAIDAAGRY
jgi:PKD repeat protein